MVRQEWPKFEALMSWRTFTTTLDTAKSSKEQLVPPAIFRRNVYAHTRYVARKCMWHLAKEMTCRRPVFGLPVSYAEAVQANK